MNPSPKTLPDQTNANLLAAAKVVLQEFGTSSDGLQELYQAVNAAIIANASAALSAQPLVGAIPEGMALVPIEPTEAMEVFVHRQAWKNAVAAAPQPLAGQQDRGEATGNAETYLRGRYGAYRCHFAWRELEEAFNAGAAIGTPTHGVDHG